MIVLDLYKHCNEKRKFSLKPRLVCLSYGGVPCPLFSHMRWHGSLASLTCNSFLVFFWWLLNFEWFPQLGLVKYFFFINNLEFYASARKDTERKCYPPYQIKAVSYQQDALLILVVEAAYASLLHGGVSYSAPLKLLHSQYKDTVFHLSQDSGSVEAVWHSSV